MLKSFYTRKLPLKILFLLGALLGALFFVGIYFRGFPQEKLPFSTTQVFLSHYFNVFSTTFETSSKSLETIDFIRQNVLRKIEVQSL